MPDIPIEHLDPEAPEVRAIIDASDAYYTGLYPAESNHLESTEQLARSDMLFIGCRAGGTLAASGAAKIMRDDGTYAEIKRVFVLDEFRGQGLSWHIMEYLEAEMQRRGVNLFRLETGIYQPAARSLYRKLGYRERGPFGAYAEDPLSIFMEKCIGDEK